MIKINNLRYIFAFVLAFGLFIVMGQVALADTYVTVTGSTVNIRSTPEINDYNRIMTIQRGETVRVVGVYGDFFRAYIPYLGYAYIAQEWVSFYRTRGTVSVPATWVFDYPDARYGSPISVAVESEYFTVVSYYGDWYGVMFEGELAYVGRSHIYVPSFVVVPPARRSGIDGGFISSDVQEEVVAKALRFLGTPYVWGGNGPHSFDCSGFVIYVLRSFGVSLPRRSRDMASSGVHVNRSDVQPGDLLFFATMGGRTVSHVGIYIGGGQLIHSSSSRTGGVIISNFYSDYFIRTFVTARRVL